MCKLFKIGKSSYYEWLGSSSSNQWQENKDLLLKIEKVYYMSNKSYGSPRIHIELKKDGISASRQRIARIMKTSGLRALAAKRFVATTDSKH